MSYTSDTLQCILNIKQTQINVLVIQCQTHLGKIFKCTIFVGYGGVINFERCRTLRKICFYREQENFFAIHSSPKYKMLDKYFVEKEHKMRMHEVFQF